ncbi:hypothetical protein GCM10009609_07750 [Pseudonocardia aurantiaca]|uniref:Uncharacterized protein n=1 Tax=Pseudonocardia aurantiaca TaxID=75290 RepID=A0ABW4FL76_9PSEU
MLWCPRHPDRTGERVRHYAAAADHRRDRLLDRRDRTCVPLELTIPFLTGAAFTGGIGAINGLGNIGGCIGTC